MSEMLVISSISGILRFGRYPANLSRSANRRKPSRKTSNAVGFDVCPAALLFLPIVMQRQGAVAILGHCLPICENTIIQFYIAKKFCPIG